MPLPAPTSRRFLALLAAAGTAIPAATAASHSEATREIPKYCQLLNELPYDQRHAFTHANQPDGISQKPLDQWTAREDAQLKEALRLQRLLETIPYDTKSNIDDAFLDARPDLKREHEAITDLYHHTPRAIYDHVLKIRRQIGRDCELQLG